MPFVKIFCQSIVYKNHDPGTRLTQDYLNGESIVLPGEGDSTGSFIWVPGYGYEDWFDLERYFSEDGGAVVSSDIVTIDPVGLFYNLFACGAARYTESNYIAGRYTFADTYGLITIGSTKSGSMLCFEDFYEEIGKGNCVGEALKEWFRKQGEDGFENWEVCWYYGLTLIGDPTFLLNQGNPNCVTMPITETGSALPFVSGLDTLAILIFVSEKLDSVTICSYKGILPSDIPEGSNWVRRYYSITPFPEDSSFETTLILFYSQNEFDASGLPDETELELCRYNSSESTWTFEGGIVDIKENSITLSGVTDFSFWAITDSSNAVGVSASDEVNELPGDFSLSQNYLNPFNPITEIKYGLPKDCWVKLEVYNILGQRVATLIDGKQKAGYKTIRWDASSFASGVYFYRLQAGDFTKTRKMILLK